MHYGKLYGQLYCKKMKPQAGRAKVAATKATVAALVVMCCAVAASGEEATDAAVITTVNIGALAPGEDDALTDEITTIFEVDEESNGETTTAKITTSTTITADPAAATTTAATNTTAAATTTAATTTAATTTVAATTTTTTTKVNEEGTTISRTTPGSITGDNDAATTTTTTSLATLLQPANTTTASEAPCGVNAYLVADECKCRPYWTRDPANPGSSCTCHDLCRNQGEVICPAEAECRQVTCHLATCTCPGHLVYQASSTSCISPCQLYGDAICGLGSGWRCLEKDQGRSFTCQCAEGYTLLEGVCQDKDECAGESGSPCGPNEECINSDGSYECACQDGFLRAANGSCINMNECLNPLLHNCDHVCRDTQPPRRYTCGCFPGHTWNDTLHRCVLDDPKASCECGPPEVSVCYRTPEGEEQCFPRPGYTRNGTAFIDVSECGEPSTEQEWCWARGKCVEGRGGSRCVCDEGFKSGPPHVADCVRVSCPEGTLLVGSECVDPCSSVLCHPPHTCRTHEPTEPSCRCLSRCLNLLQPDSNFSVYHGSFLVLTLSKDIDTPRRVVAGLEDYFGPDSIEVVSITNTSFMKLSVSQPTNVSIEFALVNPLLNIAHELPEAIRSQCHAMEGHPSLCVLPGGLQITRDSITTTKKDPCSNNPCPSELNLECKIKANLTGRFVCECVPGFHMISNPNTLGYCQDINECENEGQPCGNHQDCINTPGGFTCRSKLSLLDQNPKAVQEMAITFGVLFFLTFMALTAVLCLLKKQHKKTRELVPMTTTFENDAYK